MKVIISILTSIDVVGFTPKLFFKGQTKIKSPLGGIFSIIILILIMLATIGFGQDIWQKRKPSITLTNEFTDPVLKIDPKIVIGFRMYLDGGKDIPDLNRLIDPFVLHAQFESSSPIAVMTRYELINCQDSNIFKNNSMNITSLISNPRNYFCLNDDFTIILKGKYGAPTNSHMHLRIAICSNSTKNNNSCLPDSEIRERLSAFFVSFVYKNSYTDGKDFQDPVKYYLTSDTIKSSSYSYARKIYLYEMLDYNTDAGVLLSNEDIQSHIRLSSASPESTPDTKTKIFTNVLIGLTDIKSIYERRYVKIQDIAANVGGLIKFIMIIIEYFINFYSYVPFLENVYNNMFESKGLKPEKQPHMVTNIENSVIIKINNLKIESFNNADFSNVVPIFNKKKFTLSLTPKKHTMLEIIFRKCCREKKKYSYLNKITSHYENNLDVLKLLKQSENFNYLNSFMYNNKEKKAIEMYLSWIFFRTDENDYDFNKVSVRDSETFEEEDICKLNLPKDFIEFMKNK